MDTNQKLKTPTAKNSTKMKKRVIEVFDDEEVEIVKKPRFDLSLLGNVPEGYEIVLDFNEAKTDEQTKQHVCNCPNCETCYDDLTSKDLGVYIQDGDRCDSILWCKNFSEHVWKWCGTSYGWCDTNGYQIRKYVGNGCFVGEKYFGREHVCRVLRKKT